jgi:ribosomal protein L29
MTERKRIVLAADALLSKPVRFEQLQREIARLLPE